MATTAIDRGDPLVAPAPKGLLGPDGKPVGHRDPFSLVAERGQIGYRAENLLTGRDVVE